MLPERLLDCAVRDGRVLPRWLGTRDEVWVRELQDETDACVGLPRAEVLERLGRDHAGWPRKARAAMLPLVLGLHGFGIPSRVRPADLRSDVFREAGAAGPDASRTAVVATVAARHGMPPAALLDALYADIPAARVLREASDRPSPADLVQRYNLALAQGILARAERLSVRAGGQFKAVLRFARLQRLICEVEAPPGDDPAGEPSIGLSGPLTLFRFTTKYGRAMAAWLPVLARTAAWSIEASCLLRGERVRFLATDRDPIGTTSALPRRFDSRVEERLFKDLRRADPSWEVLREADPVRVGGRILCPDFTLVAPGTKVRVPVEVVGFWTPDYLADKLSTLRALPPDRPWIVAIDESLADRAGDLPPGPCLRYRRRVDAEALLALARERAGRVGGA